MLLLLTLKRKIREKEKRELIRPKIALRTIKLALSLTPGAKQDAILLVILVTRKDIYLKIRSTRSMLIRPGTSLKRLRLRKTLLLLYAI